MVYDGGSVVAQEAANDLHPLQGEMDCVLEDVQQLVVRDGVEGLPEVEKRAKKEFVALGLEGCDDGI